MACLFFYNQNPFDIVDIAEMSINLVSNNPPKNEGDVVLNKVIRLHKDRGDSERILKTACDELNCDFVGEIPIKIKELKEKGRLSQYRVTDFLYGISRFRGSTDNRISLTLFETFLTICLHKGRTVRQLAGQLMKDPVGVYNEIKRLEGYGLVDLITKDDAASSSRRGKTPKGVFLSEKGMDLLEEMLA